MKRLRWSLKKFLRVERKRSFLKVFGWRMISIALDATIIYLLYPFGALMTATGFIIAENIYASIIGYIYERVWTRIRWGIKIERENSHDNYLF